MRGGRGRARRRWSTLDATLRSLQWEETFVLAGKHKRGHDDEFAKVRFKLLGPKVWCVDKLSDASIYRLEEGWIVAAKRDEEMEELPVSGKEFLRGVNETD